MNVYKRIKGGAQKQRTEKMQLNVKYKNTFVFNLDIP